MDSVFKIPSRSHGQLPYRIKISIKCHVFYVPLTKCPTKPNNSGQSAYKSKACQRIFNTETTKNLSNNDDVFITVHRGIIRLKTCSF